MEPQETVRRIRELSSPLEPLATSVKPFLQTLPGIRAVLFDVYGTLFVSASGEVGTHAGGDRSQALSDAFRTCGLRSSPGAAARAAVLLPAEIQTAHEHSRRSGVEYPEVEIREIFRRVLKTLVAENLIGRGSSCSGTLEIDSELCGHLALEYECRVNPTWPMPGLRQLLSSLEAGRRELGLVSNAQFYTPWLFSAHLGLKPEQLGFREDLCAWSYLLGQAKPSPALFAPVLERLSNRSIEPAEVLYVGNDRRNDIGPAAQLGCRTALFAGDRRSYRPRAEDPDLAGVRPDLVLTALEQLPPLLSNLPDRDG
jgi:putative hydrolase of the HAD superfamily